LFTSWSPEVGRSHKFKIVQIKGHVLFKGKIITKMPKFVEVIENFSRRKPLNQNISDLPISLAELSFVSLSYTSAMGYLQDS
jgi:hypothetical protein